MGLVEDWLSLHPRFRCRVFNAEVTEDQCKRLQLDVSSKALTQKGDRSITLFSVDALRVSKAGRCYQCTRADMKIWQRDQYKE
jgi:hypothetical protein